MKTTVPERCNKPASWIAANGYRSCDQHAIEDDNSPSKAIFWVEAESTVRCDHPMDGLGAARFQTDS